MLFKLPQESRETARRFARELLAARGGASEIVRDASGKPNLAGRELHFNFSYRERWCAAAFSSDCPVGVDVEIARPIAEIRDIVDQFFPSIAQVEFAAAPPERKAEAFFLWWTRIEAAVKATGRGLDGSRSAFEGVVAESCQIAPGIFLGVAGQTAGAVTVRWPEAIEMASPKTGC